MFNPCGVPTYTAARPAGKRGVTGCPPLDTSWWLRMTCTTHHDQEVARPNLRCLFFTVYGPVNQGDPSLRILCNDRIMCYHYNCTPFLPKLK